MSDPDGAENILEVRDLQVRFAGRRNFLGRRQAGVRAVDGVSLSLGPGETLGVVGESGSGKSTLARAIVGLAPIHAGQVLVDGVDSRESMRSGSMAFRRRVQMVFQDPYASLSPRHDVASILAEPLALHGLLVQRGSAQVEKLLELVGLSGDLKHRKPRHLSGGQCQRVAIARALALEPRLILCDEPTSALDVSVQAQIINLLVELRNRLNLSYVFIGHDLAVVRQIAHRVLVMYAGRVVEEGSTAELYAKPRHPYTIALLSAAPVPDPRIERSKHRIKLPDADAGPTALERGCPFRPRCWLWKELGDPVRCVEEAPTLMSGSGGESGTSACHYADRF